MRAPLPPPYNYRTEPHACIEIESHRTFFFMVNMASSKARGRVRPTTATSRKMVAMLQLIHSHAVWGVYFGHHYVLQTTQNFVILCCQGVLAMTTATPRTTPCKISIYILPSLVATVQISSVRISAHIDLIKILNARAEPLFCSLNGEILVAAAVVV